MLHASIQLLGATTKRTSQWPLRDCIPKGDSIERYSDEDILNMADAVNQRPRRILGYHTPAELFDHFLYDVYSIDNIS